MADSPKTVDAVMVPMGYPGGLADRSRGLALSKEFGPMLGCKNVACSNQVGNVVFVTAKPGETLKHYGGHPLAGRDRYDWLDRGDGVQYGLLNAEGVEADMARAETELGKTTAEKVAAKTAATHARLAELTAIPAADLTREQADEMAVLTRWVGVLSGPKAETKTEPATEPTHAD